MRVCISPLLAALPSFSARAASASASWRSTLASICTFTPLSASAFAAASCCAGASIRNKHRKAAAAVSCGGKLLLPVCPPAQHV